MPLVRQGLISGALFAFIMSFNEVVVILFLGRVRQRIIARQMFSDLREQFSPTILSVAVLPICFTVVLMVLERLRRKNEKLRGITS